MKLLMAIVQDRDADQAVSDLTRNHFRVTRMGSTGGFLQQGNSTLIIGVEDALVTGVLDILRTACRRREFFVPLGIGMGDQAFSVSNQIEVEVGGATVFILDVERFEQH